MLKLKFDRNSNKSGKDKLLIEIECDGSAE